MTEKISKSNEFELAATAFEDGLARICRLYGVSPLSGRLYGVLFMAPRPLSLEELCKRSGAAKSSVSVALRGLARARVVRRLPPRGDRRDYYEAITDPWEVLSEWNRIYFEPELAMFRETGAGIERALDGAEVPPDVDPVELRRRLAAFRDLSAMFEQLFGTLVRGRARTAPARRIAIVRDDDDDPDGEASP